jgi:hypothetical protein
MTTTTEPAKPASAKKSSSASKAANPKAAKKSHAVATHATTTFAGLCQVKFEYDDETKEPVRNRCVAYWAYDSSGKKIDSSPLLQQNSFNIAMPYPVSVGTTDDKGNLMSSQPNGVQVSTKNADGIYAIKTNRSPVPKAAPGVAVPLNFGVILPMGKKVGFALCPIDMLKSIETGDVTKLTSKNGAVPVTIETDEQVIKLKATLPDWQYRIQAATDILKKDIENYQKYTKKHVEAISQLEMLSTVALNMIRFPSENIATERLQPVGEILKQLDDLKTSIDKQFIKNTSIDTACGKFFNKIVNSAKKLRSIIDSKDFLKELKNYLPVLNDSPSNGYRFAVENDWRDIFDTLIAAYSQLAQTPMVEKIFNEHIVPVLEKIASYGAEEKSESAEHTKVEIQETALLVIIDRFTSIAQAIGTPAPGTATLVEGIINIFGFGISNWMHNIKITQGKKSPDMQKPKDLLYGVMRIFKGGKALTLSEKGVLAKASYSKLFATGEKPLMEYAKNYAFKSAGALTARMYARTMFLFSLITLYNFVSSDKKKTLMDWFLILSGPGTGTAAATVQAFFYKHLETEIKFTSKFGNVGKAAFGTIGAATGTIAAIGGIASMIISYQDAKEALSNYENDKAIWLAIQIGGSIFLTAGYFLMIAGTAGIACGGAGIVLAAIGSVIYITTSIVLLVKDLLEEGTLQVFKQIMEEFSKDDSTFKLVYCKNNSSSTIPNLFENLKRSIHAMEWWDLSWRAVVPLFNAGFKAYQANGKDVSLGESAKLISKMISEHTLSKNDITYRSDYGKDFFVLDYLMKFSFTETNNIVSDPDGIPDAVKWANGTINPSESPMVPFTIH